MATDGSKGLRAGMTGSFKSFWGSGFHRRGMEGAKWAVASKFGLLMTGYSAYQGYKEGGVGGAVAEGGKMVAQSYLFTALGIDKAIGFGAKGIGVIGGSLALAQAFSGIAPWETGSLFSVLARPKVAEHMRKHATLEMGRPLLDQFGTLATMRQRSLMAIQNSKVNGRSALGQEAALQFRPYFR